MTRRMWSRQGFTLAEVLVAVTLGGLLLLAIARLADTTARVGEATRSGADARMLEWTTERILRRALEGAGEGMPSSPNLGGIGVRVAAGEDGATRDTLVVLRGDGEGSRVAARGCRDGAGTCIALVGDRRAAFRAGDLIVVGARGTGLAAYQITDEPEVFVAPCAADCAERLQCTVASGPALSFRRVVGSVRQPGDVRSPEPCPYAYGPDGSPCEEIVETVPASVRQVTSCRATGPTTTFTELPVADRTAVLGFPAPPIPLTRAGAGGTPQVRAIRVRASRFWVRTDGDAVLVRQNGLAPGGRWRAPMILAGPVHAFQVETLHADGSWRRGTGIEPSDLAAAPSNPNHAVRATPAAHGREAGAFWRRGHHTVAAVRIHYVHPVRTAAHGQPRSQDAWVVASTRALLQGGTGDVQ